MNAPTGLQLLPIRAVTRKIGCSRAHIYRLMRTAGFPRPVHLSKRARGVALGRARRLDRGPFGATPRLSRGPKATVAITRHE